jgi:hypothetical protein
MDNSLTIIFGMIAIVLPILAGRLVWKGFDRYFGRNDEAYMDSLEFFLKKIGLTALVALIVLWLGMSLVFSNQT